MTIKDEKGMRVAKLIKVDADANNNKYYNMFEQSDGTFKAIYGRVGSTKTVRIYEIHKWDEVYRKRIHSSGYTDKTDLFIKEENSTTNSIDISNSEVKRLVERLLEYANKSIKRNYTVSAEQVTQKQVDRAQDLINQIKAEMNNLRVGSNTNRINQMLIDLYAIIPRKMKKVESHIIPGDQIVNEGAIKWAGGLVNNEQDTLDVMKGQVVKPIKMDNGNGDFLKSHGLLIEKITGKEADKLTSSVNKTNKTYRVKVRQIYKIKNFKTQEKFDKFVNNSLFTKTLLLYHGSRNQNWWNIVKLGLLLYPNAIKTGAMFGNGIYFANKSQKAIGYSSIKESYWNNENEKLAYLSIYQVHTGKSYNTDRRESWMHGLNEKGLKSKGVYNSLFIKGGYDLENDELVIYNEAQCSIKYLVEIEER